MDDDLWRQSRFGYGCPPSAYPLLNLHLNMDPTYTDAIVAAASTLAHPVRYLELGVSVGKNLYVVARALDGATIVGVDWEPLNPVLARALAAKPRTSACSYVHGDVLDAETWARVEGGPFSLVFSDAFHEPQALEFEIRMLLERRLLDPAGFVMMWDDLNSREMRACFDALTQRLEAMFPSVTTFTAGINGWLGQHEDPHTVGFVSNTGLTHERLFGRFRPVGQRVERFRGRVRRRVAKALRPQH